MFKFKLQNSTMRIMFMYYEKDPPRVSLTPVSLPNPAEAWRPYKPLLLLQKTHLALPQDEPSSRILELRNEDIDLPYGDDSLFWCKMFKLDKMDRKYHIIKYEPIYDSSWSFHYLQHIILYECHGNSLHLEELARNRGRLCLGARSVTVNCNSIVASWSRGSEGFVFPAEAGFPLESKHNKYYLLETHYNNINADLLPYQSHHITDSSGLKIVFTQDLRLHDAGVLSIGMDPNWRHIIPPGQVRVISQGHCMEDCTALALPPYGVNVFAAMMHTHQIGREIKLRHVRYLKIFTRLMF